MILWPIEQLPIIGFNHSKEDNVLRSKPEDGPVITRKRYTKAREKLPSFTWQLSQEDKEKIEYFHDIRLASGSLIFYFSHPRIRNGAIFAVRFSEPPTYTNYSKNFWSVVCSFEEV